MNKKPIRQSWAEQRAKASRGGLATRLKARSIPLKDRLDQDGRHVTARRQPSLPRLKFLERTFPEGGEQ
jgi:hypothetical protein